MFSPFELYVTLVEVAKQSWWVATKDNGSRGVWMIRTPMGNWWIFTPINVGHGWIVMIRARTGRQCLLVNDHTCGCNWYFGKSIWQHDWILAQQLIWHGVIEIHHCLPMLRNRNMDRTFTFPVTSLFITMSGPFLSPTCHYLMPFLTFPFCVETVW